MVQPSKPKATYDDVIAAPPNTVAELLGGELFLQPRPAYPHAHVASALGMLIGPPFALGKGGPGGWFILDEPELHFGADVLVPDVAGWRKADHPTFDLDVAYSQTAPTWVCEVLSPSTRRVDRVKKMPRYAEAGVDFLWMIDPVERFVETYRRDGTTWTVARAIAGDRDNRVEPFEAVPLTLTDLWPGQ